MSVLESGEPARIAILHLENGDLPRDGPDLLPF